MQAILNEIQTWYAAQCDGNWEHAFGIEIGTMDNPGWFVRIDVTETLLENKAFAPVQKQDTEQSWLKCKVEEKQFIGYGDPTRLEEILSIFLGWAKAEPKWLTIPSESETQREVRLDNEFWAALGAEIGPKPCYKPNCERKRIRNSAFCRQHHFEMIRGRLAPTAD